MNIRKFLHYPAKKQKELLIADSANVLKNCNKIAMAERDDMRISQEKHDGICPNCKAGKADNNNNIVNNIRKVHGNGHVGGNLFGVSGSMLIDTDVVNHCNVCGNEWEKFRTKNISETHILRVCLNYLATIIKDPNEKKFEWKVEAIQVFNDCYAETIYYHCRHEKNFLYISTPSQLKLSRLRRYYKSIFDPDNKKKLEKL